MDQKLDWWNKKHLKYAAEDWIDKASIFAKWAKDYFPKSGVILELGAGHGQDSRYFADQGYQVVSSDFSDSAIEYNLQKTPERLRSDILIKKIDISKPLPFDSNTYDVAYCNLSIHYFNDKNTDGIFSEIYRVLKPEGIVAILANSTKDPEYGEGKMLEQDYYELSLGDVKHFYSKDYMKLKAKRFQTIVLDEEGTTYKDTRKGVFNLIRYVGRKPDR